MEAVAQVASGSGVLGLVGAVLLTISVLAALVFNCATSGKKASGGGAAVASAKAVKGAATPPADLRERCTILFGTQTGTAERFAKALRSQLESKYGGATAFDVVDVEHYDGAARLPKERVLFLLMATYGDGEPTDNAADFYNWLEEQAKAAGSGETPFKVRAAATRVCRAAETRSEAIRIDSLLLLLASRRELASGCLGWATASTSTFARWASASTATSRRWARRRWCPPAPATTTATSTRTLTGGAPSCSPPWRPPPCSRPARPRR
jgi:hypothetical protein